MTAFTFPYTFSEDFWVEHEGEIRYELSDDDALELQCAFQTNKLFEDVRDVQPIYDAITETIMDKIRREITEDPTFVREWIQDFEPDFEDPITEALIDDFMDAVSVRVFYPEAFFE